MSERTAIVVLTQAGLATAERVRAALGTARIDGYAARVDGAEHEFSDVASHLRRLFADGTPIVGICATGILVRALASDLTNKLAEPPVVAVSEDARAVVPVLGGHQGGNRLARTIATALGVEAAVTTTGDSRLQVALDDPPPGWRLVNREHYKSFAARLLAGEGCRIEGSCDWLHGSNIASDANGTLTVRITTEPDDGSPDRLVYCPQRFTVGVGCERGAEPSELRQLVHRALADAKISPLALAGLFSVTLKADERAVHAAAHTLGIEARFLDPKTLEALTPRLVSPSEVVFREVGCHGVAEAAALAGAGQDATLLVAKTKSKRATCAIAESLDVVTKPLAGKPRGRLTVIGLGPGKVEWRTPAAGAAVRLASHVVGYSGYLDMLGELDPRQTVLPYPLGEETQRVDQALSLASEGHDVVLVCSGDPGVYAMASLVYERLELGADSSWRRSEIAVLPGVSAMHAAAARIGAPLGHDFCAISLSDLLTPWRVIERRLKAAASGDFVIALYNPASARRRQQLTQALAIVASERPDSTPVVIARQVGREDESITVSTLKTFDPAVVDMMTLLLIGSSETRVLTSVDGDRVYTPRGYISKTTQGAAG